MTMVNIPDHSAEENASQIAFQPSHLIAPVLQSKLEVHRNSMLDTRPSPIAGTWYPGDRKTLTQSIDRYLENCPKQAIAGKVIGIVTPHAGHRYSGQVAAHAFRCLQDLQPDIVVIVSPLHYPHPASVLSTDHEAYETPLGILPVDKTLLTEFEEELLRSGDLELRRVREDREHSLEIELPFLQRTLTESFRFLPLMLSDQSEPTVKAIGHTLGAMLEGQNAVLIASSDLSHFYPQAVAQRLDGEILARLEAFNPSGVLSAEQEGAGFACGRGALAAVLWAAQDLGADRVKVLHYATSGDITADYHSVVGYGAAAIYRQAEE
jgi:AmmeMemoRadiSam system protein B